MNIVIVDDDSLVRSALSTIIKAQNINILATGSNGNDAIKLYFDLNPDILLMDIRMDNKTGIEAAEEILAKDADAKILFLTTFEDDEYIVKAIKLGTKGYILKQNFENIVPALNAVYSSQSVFGETIINRIPELLSSVSFKDCKKYNLNDKDIQMIKLVADGLSNKEIANKLCFSEGTIRNYLSDIMERLNLKSRTALVAFYYNNLNSR